MKIAFVHDFLLYWGGAERVLFGLHTLFPEAPIYTIMSDKAFVKKFFPQATINPSFSKPSIISHRAFLPFLPTAIESLNLDEYAVVISSGVFSKGIITKPKTVHIHYCHTPPRFLWEEEKKYIRDTVPFGFKILTRFTSHWLRIWDRQAGEYRVDKMIANSKWTAERIKKIYGRKARVIYPFIDQRLTMNDQRLTMNDYFLIVSRLQRYKNIELPIKVFNRLNLPLYIVGEGPDRKRLEKIAKKNIVFLGFKKEAHLPLLYRHARALILPSVEDFGLTAAEAMAQGTPVLAYKRGGAIETIKEGKTGEFFDELTRQSFWQGLQKFLTNENQYKKTHIITHAQKFSYNIFKEKILTEVNHARKY